MESKEELSQPDKLRDRLPTRQEVLDLLLVCVFPVFTWAILVFIYEAPAYRLRISMSDMFGIFAYSQAVALIESCVVLVFLIFICVAVPRKLFKDKILSQGLIILYSTILCMIPVHFQLYILEALDWNMGIYQLLFLLLILIYALVLLGMSFLIRKYPKVDQAILNFIERSSVLSTLYILIGVFSLAIILFRNII